jgi:uncharacterized protein
MFSDTLGIDYQYVTLPQWGPGLAALILSFTIYNNKQFKKAVLEKRPPKRLFLLLIIPFALIAVSYFLSDTLNLISESEVELHLEILYIVIPASLFGAVGEALGWRKFLQFSVDKHFNYIKSAIVVGLLWGLWHVGNYSNGPIYMGLFLIFTICATLILSIMIRKYNYNLLFTSIFHISINLGFYIFFRAHLNNVNMMFVNAIVWLIASIIILYSLEFKRKEKLD